MAILIAAFLLLAPRPLQSAIGHAEPLPLFQIRERTVLETITLYHIASARTYQGSVTVFLQDMAKTFENKHRGVYIRVEGLTPEAYAERLACGRTPDAYSFFCGDVYPEQLQQIQPLKCQWLPGLAEGAYAAPYLFSGYALCRTEQTQDTVSDLLSRDGLASEPLHFTRLSACGMRLTIQDFLDGKCSTAILDLRAVGDLTRSGKLAYLACVPLDPFTDKVCYLGIAKNTCSEKALWLQAFFAYLLTVDAQAQLTVLGAFPVIAGVEPTYASRMLNDIYQTYAAGVQSPDPFRWRANRKQLEADAGMAAEGDAHARHRFFERWAVVFGD